MTRVLVALLAAAALAGCAAAPAEQRKDGAAGAAVVSVRPDTDGYAGAVLDRPYRKPRGAFTDTSGRPFDWTRTKPVTIVFFGYTACPDVCNTVMADVAAALRRVEPSVRSRVDVVLVTTDPARDTPRVLRKWLDAFDPTFEGVTAPLPTIEAAASQLAVGLELGKRLPSGGYEVTHGAQLIGFGPDGLGRLVWTEGTPVGALRQDVIRLSST